MTIMRGSKGLVTQCRECAIVSFGEKQDIIRPDDVIMSLICISLEITLLERRVLTHSVIMRVFSLMTELIIAWILALH